MRLDDSVEAPAEVPELNTPAMKMPMTAMKSVRITARRRLWVGGVCPRLRDPMWDLLSVLVRVVADLPINLEMIPS
jgi:hypothetical protein